MDLDPQLNRRSNYLSIKFLGYDLMPLDGGVQCNTSPFLAGCAYRKEVSLLQPRTDLQASGNSEMLEDVGSHHIQNAFGSQGSIGSVILRLRSSKFFCRVSAQGHMAYVSTTGEAFQHWSPQIEGTSTQESRVLDMHPHVQLCLGQRHSKSICFSLLTCALGPLITLIRQWD